MKLRTRVKAGLAVQPDKADASTEDIRLAKID